MSRGVAVGETPSGIGIFGGTFNPVHLGHLRAAEEVRERLRLERVLFVPAADPPLKRGGDEPVAAATARLGWVRLAVRDNPYFAVDDCELGREGPSYSVDTLAQLGERHGRERLVFLVGQDAFREMGSWRDPDRLLTLSHFAVITRPPAPEGTLADWLPPELVSDLVLESGGDAARHRSAGTWIRRLDIGALPISATDVRRRVREGRSLRYLLPEDVRQAVLASGAYAETPPS